MCSSPLVLAQQLTHIELERLSMIGPEEFVQAFSKDSEVEVRLVYHVLCHNVLSWCCRVMSWCHNVPLYVHQGIVNVIV